MLSPARAIRILPLSLQLVAMIPSLGQTSPGQLDYSFAGIKSAQVGANVMCHALTLDGKIVLAGTSGIGLVIARRLANGDPDPSFAGDGTVIVSNLIYAVQARSVAVQEDGKIVVAGETVSGFQDFFVVRLTTAGLVDGTFSGDGWATASISSDEDYAAKVLVQPDGKIVVAGSSQLSGDLDFSVARFNSDGTLDASFSGDGKASVGFGAEDRCNAAVLQADGKLVLAGGSWGSLDQDIAVARLNPDGSADNSFDDDGEVTTGLGGSEAAYAVAIQPSDHRIVVAGTGAAVRYYSSDGSLDDSFDGDGKLSIPIGARDIAVTPGGKIMLVGIFDVAVGEGRALRLNSNGSLDPEWADDGDVTLDTGLNYLVPPSLSLQPDGRVLFVVPKGGDCRLLQFWADGSADDGGRQAVAFDDVTFPPGSHEMAYGMAVQADGKIVLAGEVTNPGYTETDFALARFLPDGRLDTSFGVHGRVALSLGNYDYGRAIAIQSDGKIVVAGYTGVGNATNFMIARFNSSGTLDNSFGFGGYNAVDFAGGADFGWALALQPDGKILVAGTVSNGARDVYGVARFSTDGTLDHSFDLDGKQLVEFAVGPSHWASAMVVQASGRIVVGGTVGGDFALVGITPNGSVDQNFGLFGLATRDLGGSDYLESLVMGTDGRIYAAGTRVIAGNGDWALSRWPAGGGAFPCNGGCPWTSAFVDFGATSGWAYGLHVRSDGEMVMVGKVGESLRWEQFSPGITTPTLGSFVRFPGSANTGLAVKFTGSNQLVVAGFHGFQGDHNMALSRFETIPNTTVAVDEPTWTEPSLRLTAPYPNPLVGRSTFAFELPRKQSVRLAIHDASGRRVRTLMDGELAAGRHQRLWDGTDDQGRSVASGIYFARLASGADHTSASIVVLR